MRYSRGGRETVTADLKPKGIYYWTFACFLTALIHGRSARQDGHRIPIVFDWTNHRK